jgi:Skp family chaperone for outer membrane proteins
LSISFSLSFAGSSSSSSSSSSIASEGHADVRLVLSAVDTTDTKTAELKSLRDKIANELHHRREDVQFLQTELKALTARMQALASPFL